MSYCGLQIAECRWWRAGNISVRALFETVASVHNGNPHGIRHDMFTNASSLQAIIQAAARETRTHSVYIAAHGKRDRLIGLNKSKISRACLRHLLRSANSARRISGLYLGTCALMNAQNAEFLLDRANQTGLKWVAGYSKYVDWIDSSAFDMVFWANFLDAYDDSCDEGLPRRRAVDATLDAVHAAMSPMRSMAKELGFEVYRRSRKGDIACIWS